MAVRGIEKFDILPIKIHMDILFNNQHKLLKFCLCTSLSYLGPTFHFMKFRK